MAVSTRKKKKKFSPFKFILIILVAGALLNAMTEGALAETLQDLVDEIAYHLGFDPGAYVPDPDLGDGSDSGSSGNEGTSGGGSSADNSGSSSGNGGSSSGNSGSSDNSGSSSSGKSTIGSGSKPNVPSASKNNVFLNTRDQGISASLTGDVLITTVFVSDKSTSWTKAEMNAIKEGHETMTKAILAEAKAWGVDLKLTLEYRTASVTDNLATASHKDWYEDALKSAGLSATASEDLEKSRKVKEAPVLFYLDLTGRAFASSSAGKSNRTEYAVFYSGDSGAANYRHELYHLFGAKDFYYPAEVESLGKKYFPNSTMLTAGKDASTDSLTAYLIGWTDQLDATAKTFLSETNWITTDYLKDEHEKETYTGYVENWDMGSFTYTGYLVDGVQQGQGTMVWDNGNKYVGNWDYGQMHGQGTFTWSNGAVYKGSFHKGVRQGTGRYTFASGAWYEGDFVGGKFHGQGTYHWTSGDVYVGQWKDDVRTGRGKLTFADGAWYEGDFVDGKFQGTGTRVYSNGARYEGQWKNHKCHGQGKLIYANGSWYEGSFSEGKFNGQGTMVYSNGDRYEGQWKDDQRHGQGTYTYTNGTQKSGKWENNKFVG